MTIVEQAAYLKGLAEGLGVESDSRDGKLWGALTTLLSDMAHEIEDLQASNMDYADALDEVCDELNYMEELVCDLDLPEEEDWDGYEDDDFDDEVEDNIYPFDAAPADDEEPADGEELPEEEDEEDPTFDGILYDVTCPSCGQEISFDEKTLDEGSITCPGCGEVLEFDLGDE